MITVCTVRRVSRVQFFVIFLCKSAIRRLFFSVLQHSCFLHSQPSVCSGWVGFGLSFAWRSFGGSCSFVFVVWAGTPACCRAALIWGIRNRKETKNQNPESTNQRKQVLRIREKLLCRTREQVKKSSHKNSLSKFVQPLFLVRAMIMGIEIKCVVNDSKHPGSVAKQPAGYYHFVYKKVICNLLDV